MPTLEPGQELLGRYRLGRRIGAGGMGSIFVAHDVALNRPVAVKFMSEQFVGQPDLRARFEREARTAAGLRSAHIVEVFDVGSVDGTPFMVMELLDGEDLGARMRSLDGLPIEAVASVILQAARGLEVAHRAGVVHRDIKPANLFLARQGESEVVKVLDFGIAKSPAPMGESTLTDETLGSPHYMSPEQAKGAARVDSRADVWSLGVVAYRLLAGKPPFDGPGAGAIFVALCTEPHPPISRVRPDLPAGLDAFFDRALAKDPAQRFPSAMALASDLAISLGRSAPTFDSLPAVTAGSASAPHTPVAAPPPARPDVEGTLTEVVSPVHPRPRRRRATWWAAGVVVLAVGVGAGAAARMRASERSVVVTDAAEPRATEAPSTTAAASSSAPAASSSSQVEVTVASVSPHVGPSAAPTAKPRPSARATSPPAPVPTTPAPAVTQTATTAPAPMPSASAKRIQLGI